MNYPEKNADYVHRPAWLDRAIEGEKRAGGGDVGPSDRSYGTMKLRDEIGAKATASYAEDVWIGYKTEMQRLNCANKLNGRPKGMPKKKFSDLRTRTLVAPGESPCTP